MTFLRSYSQFKMTIPITLYNNFFKCVCQQYVCILLQHTFHFGVSSLPYITENMDENHPSNEPNKIENQNQANPLFNLSLKVLKDYMVFLVWSSMFALLPTHQTENVYIFTELNLKVESVYLCC